MVLARMTFFWSLLAHGGVVAGLLWFGPGSAERPRLTPPLVQIEWRQTAAVAAAAAPVETPVEIEPVLSEPVVDSIVDDALQPTTRPEVDGDAPDQEPSLESAPPPFAELRRSLRPVPPPAVAQLPTPPPVPTATEPLARVLVPIAGTTIAPRYPASARRRGQEGTVLLAVTVAADGAVTEALVVRSSGHAVLDEEAVRTVRQWRFAGGPGVCEQAIEFRLHAAAG